MSQANLSLANAAGAIFRAALNAAIGALVTNNSGATEPSPTYPNMWWYDTANAQLKRRNNANDAWIVLGLEAASTDGTMAANSDSLVPTQKAGKTYADTKIAASALDTDVTLAANSDAKVATQKAGKTYADTKLSKTTTGEIAALTEKTTLADDDVFLIEDSAASNAKKKVKKSNIVTSNILTAGTDITVASAMTERTTTSSSYVKLKEINVGASGTATVSFKIRSTSDYRSYGRIYKNGSAVGTEREYLGGGSGTTFSENIAMSAGDLIQLYVRAQAGGFTAYASEFVIKRAYQTSDTRVVTD
jgi:hypothetical protein